MYVCMYIHAYVCAYVHTRAYMHTGAFAYVRAYVHMHVQVNMPEHDSLYFGTIYKDVTYTLCRMQIRHVAN